ncbi:chaplin [Embleya sp. NBC_00888]|uniref:chaplin n=1 Tax=Embleya sp. NBC_00888 TaxID=2975960 RepID=UPI00386357AE
MHQLAKKGLLVVVATTGALASAAVGVAGASSGAQGAAAGSPGVASGNNIQVPIHVPVNVCGNTVNVVGALNPAFGNNCVNGSHQPPTTHPPTTKPPTTKPPTTKPPTTKPPTTKPPTTKPPTTKPPTTKPPTTGGTSGGTTGGVTGGTTGGDTTGTSGGGTGGSTNTAGSLAQTGSDALVVAPIGAALLLGGFVLYRRSRPAQD